MLWALRQWHQDRALPAEGSILRQGFKTAGLLSALPDFAIAMDAFLFGARRAIEIHQPTCASVSRDEATVVALCGLAQGDFDGPLLASLDKAVELGGTIVQPATRAPGVTFGLFADPQGHVVGVASDDHGG